MKWADFKILYLHTRNYKSTPQFDELCAWFLDGGRAVTRDEYYASIEKNGVTLRFWVANKFYAFGTRGSVAEGENVLYEWDKIMPSNRLILALHRLTEAAISKGTPLDEVLARLKEKN